MFHRTLSHLAVRPTRQRTAVSTAPTVTAVMLYLVQHGRAVPEHEDEQRPLTDRGADDVSWVAHWAIDRFAVRPHRIVHSGKTRSRQTAEIWVGWSPSTPRKATVWPPR